MAKEQVIETEGIVIDSVKGIYKVKIDNSDHVVEAHVSGKMRIHIIRISAGDKVKLELSPYDLTHGRITFRYNNTRNNNGGNINES